MDNEILKEQIGKLSEKYEAMGQDMNSYLDGLLISNYLPYWDYTNVDTLLTLQKPRTDFPDELIFVIYHQITELYFRLALHEYQQIACNGRKIMPNGEDMGWNDKLDAGYFKDRIRRINNYFEALTKSYGIMEYGMDKEQFLRFRMALLPASGFQSAQYRKIEICSTTMNNLVHKDHRDKFRDTASDEKGIREMFQFVYWKAGATEMETGKKTLTLKQFEQRYSEELIELALEYTDGNLWVKYKELSAEDQANPDLIAQMKMLDANVNINWPMVHYKTAARYLLKEKDEIAATGGTNWQKYLPPRFMKRIFFPDLWSEEEKENWGKTWVQNLIADKK
ncbi:MAG: tryptophan 2,3-dioxygenase family protein [Flavobacteriales bacterium]|jgi:tryptophan 2,3-dioxygenase|nr:tryptophan 2,3-dioxygenase family protein [Flavobacteriales bacterium]